MVEAITVESPTEHYCILELLKALKSAGMCAEKRIRVVMREPFLSSDILHGFACVIADLVISQMDARYADLSVAFSGAVKVKRDWMAGNATDEQLAEAGNAAKVYCDDGYNHLVAQASNIVKLVCSKDPRNAWWVVHAAQDDMDIRRTWPMLATTLADFIARDQKHEPVAGCECIDAINKRLADRGLEIRVVVHMNTITQTTIAVLPKIPLIRTDGKRMKKEDPECIAPMFCPWCGKKYAGRELGAESKQEKHSE